MTSDDIFSDFPESSSKAAPTLNGGQLTPKDLAYEPPKGPIGINDPMRPGIGGTNHGNCGTQRK